MRCDESTTPEQIGRAIRAAILFFPRIAYSVFKGEDKPAPPPAIRTVARVVDPDEQLRGEVIDWVKRFEARNGRRPKIPEALDEFPDIPRTTMWRRIKSA